MARQGPSPNSYWEKKGSKSSRYTGTSYSSSYSSYDNHNFYKRKEEDTSKSEEDSALLHQALLPPSRAHIEHDAYSSSHGSSRSQKSVSSSGFDGSENTSRRRITVSRENSAYDLSYEQQRKQFAMKPSNSSKMNQHQKRSILTTMEIPMAALVWYILGVISIGTTKVLLRDHGDIATPLNLTLQQMVMGFIFLQFWILIRGNKNKKELHQSSFSYRKSISNSKRAINDDKYHDRFGYIKLILTGFFFTLGFYLTNESFSGADPSFVETIKASEPITSALLSVLCGLEKLTFKEVFSLILICVGAVISTLGNVHDNPTGLYEGYLASMTQSFLSSGIVMGANLCFSFRGLFQKLFRSTKGGNPNVIDDLNLQCKVHLVGIICLLIPFVMIESTRLLQLTSSSFSQSSLQNEYLNDYLGLAVINAFTFTHYNLASSFILTRISVVHHATLNCMRRLFAIVVTSIAFGVSITQIGAMGILTSLGGFSLYTRFKAQRQNKKRHPTSLLPIAKPS